MASEAIPTETGAATLSKLENGDIVCLFSSARRVQCFNLLVGSMIACFRPKQ
jgi:hypothetical protein